MASLLIEGGHRLAGRVSIEGNKNAALPLLAACLLTEDECVLENVPRIGDVEVMARLLVDVGASVEGIGTTTLRVRAPRITKHEPDRALVGRLRGSVLLLSPLLARTGKVHLAAPGGDFPARRSIGTHLEALRQMGVRRVEHVDFVLEAPDGLSPASMYLYEASVTGTEAALLAAAKAEGTTHIRHAAAEPHVVELCHFLTKMGATVEGIGSSSLTVHGTSRLRGASHRLGGDYIEAGSWAVVGAITGADLAIEGAREEDIEVVAAVLHRMHVDCGISGGSFEVRPSKPKAVRRITTGLWPSFPSDLVSLVTVLATQAEGRTLVHDWMYELRLFALEQMSGMGADLFLADAHRIIVQGPTRLRGGRLLDSRDLRSGMSLIAAGLAADGQTRVTPLETVERGYSQLVARLEAIGAQVSRVE
jgi:UDP-N-acetylglucosamine 1-carboxyvinyltransferase